MIDNNNKTVEFLHYCMIYQTPLSLNYMPVLFIETPFGLLQRLLNPHLTPHVV